MSPTRQVPRWLPQTSIWLLALIGTGGAVVAGILWSWIYAPMIGWAVACLVYLVVVWSRVAGMDAAQTAEHAVREAPGRALMDLMLVIAALASLVDLVYVLVQAKSATEPAATALAVFAIVSVGLSWAVIHTLFTLRYARQYHLESGGIDFNQTEPPTYRDFAYVAFTLGMTYQVSDTNISSPDIRAIVLRHTLLSYLFGTVVLAATINLIAGLLP